MAFNIAELMATFRVEGTQSTVRSIEQVQAGFTQAGAAAEKSGQRMDQAVNRAARATTAAGGATSKYREQQLRAAAAVERFNTVLGDERATLARVAAAEASVIAANRRLAASSPVRSIEATSAAAEAQVGAFGRARAGVAGFMDSMARLGIGLAGFEAVLKGIDLIKGGSDFQKQMLQIHTMAGASTAEVQQMSKALLALSPQVAVGPDELAKALYHVEQTGYRGQQALTALKVGAEGAKIGMADVETTTNAATIAMVSGIKGVEDVSKAMGSMIAIAGTGDMRLEQLTEAMGTGILSTAKQFGASLNDVAAVMATMGDNGIRGTEAAQGLRQILMGMASPAKRGADSLDLVGLHMNDLKNDMEKHGLVHAMNDLNDHMKAAGITGKKVGGFITDVFGRRAGKSLAVIFGEIDRVNKKAEAGLRGAASFESKWQATTQTVAFGWERIGAEAQTAGVQIFEAVGPTVGKIGKMLADDLPKAAHVAADSLHPFVLVWQQIGKAVGPTEHALSAVGDFLKPVLPVVKGVTAATLAMWLAWAGYGVAWKAVNAIQDAAIGLGAKVKGAAASVTGSQDRMASGSVVTSRIMQAEFAKIEAAALQSAAVQARATAMKAQSLADEVAASKAATDAEVMQADRAAAAALAQAKAAAEAARTSAAAAETTAADIDTAGAAATAGWRSVLGPIGLAVIGIMTVVSMFHKSTDASKEATDAVNAYADALKSAQGPGDILDAIITQLKKDNVAGEIDKLNRALGHTVVTGPAFASAIADGGQALDQMRSKLEAVIAAGTSQVQVRQGFVSHAHLPVIGSIPVPSMPGPVPGEFVTKLTPAAKAATKALAELNKQYFALSAATKKDLKDTKEWAGVSSAIQRVAQSTHEASQTAKQYAQMVGIQFDKNGVAAVSANTLAGAVNTVSHAYNTATVTGDSFLAALKTFSGSAGTASDRAALIGATLVAANGDALSYAGAMNDAAVANHGMIQSLGQAASKIGKSGISIGALMSQITNLKRGTIDYKNAAAQPLIQGLQQMQSAAMGAAQATFQHERATKGAKRAADAAYNVYESQTKQALIDEASKLGITRSQAKRLADQYFGMPKRVKTLIEQEGANPVVTVLKQIRNLLADLTGHPWRAKVHVDTAPAAMNMHGLLNLMGQLHNKKVVISERTNIVETYHRLGQAQLTGHADGGTVRGAGGPTSDSVLARLSPGEEVIRASQAGKHRGLLKAINAGVAGFASGGTVSAAARVSHALAGVLRPDPSTPAGWRAWLIAAARAAIVEREQYDAAKANLQQLNAHAHALDRDAKKMADAAAAMKTHTKAERAAKDAAEVRAKAAQKVADAADKTASRAQKAYDRVKQASQSATAKAKQDAQSLVAAVQSAFDTLQQNVTGFESTISQGLTAGSDLSTMFGGLTSNVDSAKQALDAAKSALAQAMPDTSKLAAAQSAQAAAQQAQAAAHAQLTQALAGGNAAQILAAQQAQTTAASNLAAAQQAVTAATPTADQLAAQASAQQDLAAAQSAYNKAVQAASAGGVAGLAAQFAASEQQFANDLSTLQSSGAGQALITQLAGMGDQAGDALAKGLINDPASLAAISKSMDAINNIAGAEGDKLAKGYYGSGVASMQQLLAGIEDQFPATQKALQGLAAQLAALFVFTPTVAGSAGSAVGGKTVTIGHIHQLQTVAKLYDTTIAALKAANPSLAGDSAKSAVRKGTKLVIPAFASGVTDFAGGLAYVHRDELLVDLPRHSSVVPANRAKNMLGGTDLAPVVSQLRELNGRVDGLAEQIGQAVGAATVGVIDRHGQAQAERMMLAHRGGRR